MNQLVHHTPVDKIVVKQTLYFDHAKLCRPPQGGLVDVGGGHVFLIQKKPQLGVAHGGEIFDDDVVDPVGKLVDLRQLVHHRPVYTVAVQQLYYLR
ncbi:MAG: hypothetical protein AB2792_22575, partial [Candidatus Thiodiazotropha sp.]